MQGFTTFLIGLGVGAVLGGVIVPKLQVHRSPAQPDRPQPAQLDKVELASEESFPASDAPAY